MAAALVFVASLVVTGRQLASHAKLEAAGHRIGFWENEQALLEAVRLRTEFHRLPTAADGGAALTQRFDILWSRLITLQGGRNETRTYPALIAVRERVPAFLALLERIEQEIPALVAQEAGALQRAEAILGELITGLAAANRELHWDRQIAAEAVAQGLGRLHVTFALSALGLIASAALLCGLLFWLWRRSQRSLASAEASQERAGRSERLLRVLVDALPVMVSAHDRSGRFLLANAALAGFLGRKEKELVGQPLARVTGSATDAMDVAAALSGERQLPFREIQAAGADGVTRTLLTTTAPVTERSGPPAAVVRILVDISERKAAEEQIRHIAEHDSLTGLANRVLFGRALEAALAAGGMVALHLIDLDDFKDVNDTMGHGAGDALLMAAAARMRSCLRRGEMLARLGGDEFAVVQPGIASEAEADEAAERISRALAAPHVIEGARVSARGSIGTVIGPMDGVDGPALLQRADIALYRAKAAGKGQAQRYSGAMEAALLEQRRLETDVLRAMEDGAFHFAFQPKFRLNDLTFAGCEALVRWNHPTRGAVPPSVFVPVTEAAGLSVRFAQFTLRTAMRQQKAWAAAGLDVPVAINISARHIVSGQAPALLQEALDAEGGDPARIEIEVTEDVFIRDPETAATTLAALRQIGVRLALDDFGTGYASLGYLQQLPFDVIKLDRSFVAGLGTSARTEQIVEAVVRIAHGLGAKLVAEGVENALHLAHLRAIGCDEGQGYLLGRPMAPEALARLLQGQGGAGTTRAMIPAA